MSTVTVIQPKTAYDKPRLLRVAAYCRVSSGSDDQLNSYGAQLTYYSHKFDGSETEELIDIYADESITGTSAKNRTEFLRLIEDCKRGKIDRIYTKSISRFARNTRDCLKSIRELKKLGVTIMFEKENIDTAKINDELMITIMGGLAQEESTSISQNLKWSIRRKMKSGAYSPVQAPFGYRLSNKTLVVDENEAAIVKDIFDYFINGHGIPNTTEYVNKKYGVNPPFAVSTIRYMLMNEKYIGDTLCQKTFTPDIIGAIPQKNNGEKDQYYIEATHRPIINKKVFTIAQQLLDDRKILVSTRKKDVLTGKIVCGKCGGKYVLRNHKEEHKWGCIWHITKAERCVSKYISEEEIKDAFIRMFNKLYVNYKELLLPIQRSLHEQMIKHSTGSRDVIELRRSLLKLKEQLKVIATLHTKGFFNDSKYMEQSTEINVKINKLNKDIRLLSQSDDTTLKEIEMLIDFFEKREHIMIEFEPQKFVFFIDKIVVKDNILEFHIVGGLRFTEEL